MEWVSVQNSSGYGLCLVDNFDVLIANSSFANNNGGGMLIYSYGNIEFNNITIFNNIAKYHGGRVSIRLYGKDSIEFNNCTIHSNRAQYIFYINLHGMVVLSFNTALYITTMFSIL